MIRDFFAGIGIFSTCFVIFFSCRSDIPVIDVKVWASSPKYGGIERSQDKEFISCNSSEFDNFLCVSHDDFKKIFDLILKCEKWPKES